MGKSMSTEIGEVQTSEITVQEMCKEMVANDIQEAKQRALLRENGYDIKVSFE